MNSKRKIRNILTHPNTLTLFRVLSVPGIVILLLFPNRFNAFDSLSLGSKIPMSFAA